MRIKQIVLGDTGCVSYIVLCEKENIAAIIDPFDKFEKEVEDEIENLGNPKIKYIMDTHTHADRKISSPYFAKKYETEGIVKSEKTKYQGLKIKTKDGDIFQVGDVKIEVLFTPGHTADHNCYLIDELCLLSGDSIFIGDIGRIDLGGDYREKSDLMFACLRRLEKLPKETKVYPNHVGAVHAISSEKTFSTIGKEVESNEALQIKDKDEFYIYMTEGWPPKPDNWEAIVEYNMKG